MIRRLPVACWCLFPVNRQEALQQELQEAGLSAAIVGEVLEKSETEITVTM